MQMTLSEKLWGDWTGSLPWAVGEPDLLAERTSYEAAIGYISIHQDEILGAASQDGRFFGGPASDAKRRYYENIADFFSIKKAGVVIGLVIGTPVDWSTYYIRSAFTDREYRGQQAAPSTVAHVIRELSRAGVYRFEADTSPNNTACLAALHRLGFQVTGFNTSERWGALVKLTKLVEEQAQVVFEQQFCGHRTSPRPREVGRYQ